jgi:hypothetical protein
VEIRRVMGVRVQAALEQRPKRHVVVLERPRGRLVDDQMVGIENQYQILQEVGLLERRVLPLIDVFCSSFVCVDERQHPSRTASCRVHLAMQMVVVL